VEERKPATEITVHLNFGNRVEEKTVQLKDLSDEDLLKLYEDGFTDARYVLRERTGSDPAVNFFNMTPEDVDWKIDWLKRNGKYDEYVSGGNDRA
jgi:hypothetical protein